MILPNWAMNNPRFFVMMHRKLLESQAISCNLHEWIDLIFGYKQTGKNAVDALNVFYVLTYENMIDLDKIKNFQEVNGILDQINEYGQVNQTKQYC